MAEPRPLHPESDDPPALQLRAIDNLRYIRETMERAAAFTAVPGRGMVAVGFTALVANVIAERQATNLEWLLVWLGEGVLALAIALVAMSRKSQRAGLPLWAGPARKVASGLLPPWVAAAPITYIIGYWGFADLLPGIWLLLYGCGIVAGGAHSVRAVPLMGVCTMLLGTIALLGPSGWGDVWMGAGFGLLHIVFGIIIACRYGG